MTQLRGSSQALSLSLSHLYDGLEHGVPHSVPAFSPCATRPEKELRDEILRDVVRQLDEIPDEIVRALKQKPEHLDGVDDDGVSSVGEGSACKLDQEGLGILDFVQQGLLVVLGVEEAKFENTKGDSVAHSALNHVVAVPPHEELEQRLKAAGLDEALFELDGDVSKLLHQCLALVDKRGGSAAKLVGRLQYIDDVRST